MTLTLVHVHCMHRVLWDGYVHAHHPQTGDAHAHVHWVEYHHFNHIQFSIALYELINKTVFVIGNLCIGMYKFFQLTGSIG